MFSVELNGKKINHDVSECPVIIFDEMDRKSLPEIKGNDDRIQNKQGIYIFYDLQGYPFRIGKAVYLRARIGSYYIKARTELENKILDEILNNCSHVSVVYHDNPECIEMALIRKYKPKFNICRN